MTLKAQIQKQHSVCPPNKIGRTETTKRDRVSAQHQEVVSRRQHHHYYHHHHHRNRKKRKKKKIVLSLERKDTISKVTRLLKQFTWNNIGSNGFEN